MTKLPTDRARSVREGEALDVAALEAYLREHLPGFAGPLEVRQFPSGHSNLTYLLREDVATSRGDQDATGDAGGDTDGDTDGDAAGGARREYVLRRPPFGARIATAHDMGREYRILSRLRPRFAKVPRALLYCEDEGVIGAPFYVMERLRGVILRDNQQAAELGIAPATMGRLCTALVDGLAELHAVDLDESGLADLGKPAGYVERQVTGWTQRYRKAQTDELPEVDEAIAWLAANQPPERGVALIHGDYKYDNLVLDPADPTRIQGILDWEMATVGDPLMDLGTTLGYWVDPADPEENKMLPVGPTLVPGNLDRRQVVERYAEASGRDPGDALFDYIYGLFKVAVIAQQIYKRYRDGHTTDPRFAMMIVGVNLLGQQAARAIDRGRIHDLG